MGRDQRRRSVDKPARGAVSAVDAALAALGLEKNQPRKPGEFTVNELAEASGLGRCIIQRKLKAEKWTCRSAVEGGKRVSLWSRAG